MDRSFRFGLKSLVGLVGPVRRLAKKKIRQFIYYVNYHGLRKVFYGIGAGAGAALVIIILIANFMPSYWLKDNITIGDITITKKELQTNLKDSEAHLKTNSHLVSPYTNQEEGIADDAIMNSALKDKATQCGVEPVSPAEILESLEEGTGDINKAQDELDAFYKTIGDFGRIRRENAMYQERLQDCVIQQRTYFAMYVSFDKEYFWNLEDANKVQQEYNNVQAMLNDKVLPLFQQGKSKEDIARVADEAYGIYADVWDEDHDSLSDYYSQKPMLVAEMFDVEPGIIYFNNTREEEYPGMPDINTLPSMDSRLNELQNVGDHTETFYGKSDMFMIARLEYANDGTYETWDDFLYEYKEEYAYNKPVTNILAAVKSFSVATVNWINKHLFASVFADCIGNSHNYMVKIYTRDKATGNGITDIKLDWVQHSRLWCSTKSRQDKWVLGAQYRSDNTSYPGTPDLHHSDAPYGITQGSYPNENPYWSEAYSVDGSKFKLENSNSSFDYVKYPSSNSHDNRQGGAGVALRHNCNQYAPVIAFNLKDNEEIVEKMYTNDTLVPNKGYSNNKIKFLLGKNSHGNSSDIQRANPVGKRSVVMQILQMAGPSNNAYEAGVVFYFKSKDTTTEDHNFQAIAESDAPKSVSPGQKLYDTVTVFDSNISTGAKRIVTDISQTDWPNSKQARVVGYQFSSYQYKCENNALVWVHFTDNANGPDLMGVLQPHTDILSSGWSELGFSNDVCTQEADDDDSENGAVQAEFTSIVNLSTCTDYNGYEMYNSDGSLAGSYGDPGLPENPAVGTVPPGYAPANGDLPQCGVEHNKNAFSYIDVTVRAYGPYPTPQTRLPALVTGNGHNKYYNAGSVTNADMGRAGTSTQGMGTVLGVTNIIFPPGHTSAPEVKGTFEYQMDPPGVDGYKVLFDDYSTDRGYFDGSENWPPGYYYFVVNINRDEQTDDDAGNFLEKANWYSPFAMEKEATIMGFQPYATSDVDDGDPEPDYNGAIGKFVTPGETIRDVLEFKPADSIAQANSNSAAPDSHWIKDSAGQYINVNFCVTAYGPYSIPQNTINNGENSDGGMLNSAIPPSYDTTGNKKNTICQTATGPGDTKNYDFSTTGWTPGYYYFVTTLNKDDGFYDNYMGNPVSGERNNSLSSDYFIGNWISKFNPPDEDEVGVRQFQPYFTSASQKVFIDDIQGNGNDNNGNTHQVVDTVKSHAANSLADANSGAENNGYWLDSDTVTGNGRTPVRVCVKVWGPYQTAQPYSEDGAPPNVIIDSDSKVPDGISPKTPLETICSNQTTSGTGSQTSGDFTDANQTRNFVFNTVGWQPGYYYFTESMVKTAQPLEANRNFLIGDWYSRFNPRQTGSTQEDEATIEKFQIKATSQTRTAKTDGQAQMDLKTGISGDADHNGSVATGESDTIPALKPTDEYIEDSIYLRAYDTNSGTDTNSNPSSIVNAEWLKDRNGHYITFYVCANVYGPYQQPQGAGNSLGSSARVPAAGIGQVNAPNIPASYDGNLGRKQCFWTNNGDSNTDNVDVTYAGVGKTPADNKLVQKPSNSGGPGEYKIRWNNFGDNYFQPGYYYIVWDVQTGGQNTQDTWVDIGDGPVVNQQNGQFLESNFYSPFGEQSESFYSQFQPIAKSEIPVAESTDNQSGRKKSEGNQGIVMECDENKFANTINYVDHPEEYPHEKLHCEKVEDNIFLGAVNDKAIIGDGNTQSTDNNDLYWPKTKDGIWEPVKFQVKLFGPFKDAESREPSNPDVAGRAGVVSISTVQDKVYAAQSIYGQPIAESCVMTTSSDGPNWDGSPTAYVATFTQNFNSCNGNTPSNTVIELPPGFYVSIVEIVRDDLDDLSDTPPHPFYANYFKGNDGVATQNINGLINNMHNMLIGDRFTSAWGDPLESLMVPLPLYITTRRDNSGQEKFYEQVTINDQYFIHGFDAEYADGNGGWKPWKDIYGDNMPKYGEYLGKPGYFNRDKPNGPESIHVALYGAYPSRPTGKDPKYCNSGDLIEHGLWELDAKDTGYLGENLSMSSPLTKNGWYVFQYIFKGGERISDIETSCGDTSEMFRIVSNNLGLYTTAGSDSQYAPTRVTDTVQVTGTFTENDKGSIVKLRLYRRTSGATFNSPGQGDGAPLCTVIFTVDKAGAYNTATYTDKNGYVRDDMPGAGASNRCWAETAGHYYWIEEFLLPGSDPLNPKEDDNIQPPGVGEDGEFVDILPPPVPEVTTDADPTTSVNKPFRDTALVTNIPEGNTKTYYLYFTAYGPYADGTVDCNNNEIHSSQNEPIAVTKNGSYFSKYITVSTTGLVYWIEHLEDEDGNVVDEGECGARRETTYVTGPGPASSFSAFEPFQAMPLYPASGYLTRQVAKIVSLLVVTMLGAWQLTDKNSWLLRKR